MPVTLDLSTDFQVVADGLEAVTLKRRGSSDDVDVANALQRAITTKEAAASNGQYTTRDVRWHLPVLEVTTRPRLGDVILDANNDRWTILDVQKATLEVRWRCICRNVAVYYSLDDYVDVLRATISKGAAGAATASWQTEVTGVRASIHLKPAVATDATATPVVENQAHKTRKLFEVRLERDLNLTRNYLLRDARGTLYEVLGYRAQQEIGEFQATVAEVQRAILSDPNLGGGGLLDGGQLPYHYGPRPG